MNIWLKYQLIFSSSYNIEAFPLGTLVLLVKQLTVILQASSPLSSNCKTLSAFSLRAQDKDFFIKCIIYSSLQWFHRVDTHCYQKAKNEACERKGEAGVWVQPLSGAWRIHASLHLSLITAAHTDYKRVARTHIPTSRIFIYPQLNSLRMRVLHLTTKY